MNVYLLPWSGTGTPADPFTPQGVDQLGSTPWSCIDLRADVRAGAGRCIVGTDGLIDVSGIGNGRLLSSDLDGTVPVAVRAVIRTALGVTAGELPDVTPRQIIRRLLVGGLGREDGTRWKPLRAQRVGVLNLNEAFLNGEMVFRDVT